MEFFVIAVLLGLIPAAVARGKGRNFGIWWLFGTLLFVVALPVAIVMAEDQEGIQRKRTFLHRG